jgi:hypothetical protein
MFILRLVERLAANGAKLLPLCFHNRMPGGFVLPSWQNFVAHMKAALSAVINPLMLTACLFCSHIIGSGILIVVWSYVH